MNYVKDKFDINKITNEYCSLMNNILFYKKMKSIKIAVITNNVIANDAVGNNFVNKVRLFREFSRDTHLFSEFVEDLVAIDIKKDIHFIDY